MWSTHYDVLIVGGGIAGCSLAHALSTLPRPKPLRICLLERSLAEPDRIVGELLQPGGVAALTQLGLASCLEHIDAVPVRGYAVVQQGETVHIPYPAGYEGRSFHHGRFVQNLRAAAAKAQGVEVVEATVTELVECNFSKRVIGVRASRRGGGEDGDKEAFFADLVVVADGCFSNFRDKVLVGAGMKPETKSHFVGAILEDVKLPIPNHGTVVLVKGSGPVLLYQISERDTRMLVDVRAPLPADLKKHILTQILPSLPPSLHASIHAALSLSRLRRMPNSFLPPLEQGLPAQKEGVLLLGDAWNMRHPLTGGGMTVALHDVVLLRELLGGVQDLAEWDEVKVCLGTWHWRRKALAGTVNVLSVALYDLFGADDELLAVLRTGCFKYFERGGQCVAGPVSLLSAIAPSPLLLFNHFFAVALYSIWVMFTHPTKLVGVGVNKDGNGKVVYTRPRVDEYPVLVVKSLRVFWKAIIVFTPLIWSELRWWNPADPPITQFLTLVALLVGVAGVGWYAVLALGVRVGA